AAPRSARRRAARGWRRGRPALGVAAARWTWGLPGVAAEDNGRAPRAHVLPEGARPACQAPGESCKSGAAGQAQKRARGASKGPCSRRGLPRPRFALLRLTLEGLQQAEQVPAVARLGQAHQRGQERLQHLALAQADPLGPAFVALQAVLLLVELAFLDQLPQPLPAARQPVLLLVEPAALDELVDALGALAARLLVPVAAVPRFFLRDPPLR